MRTRLGWFLVLLATAAAAQPAAEPLFRPLPPDVTALLNAKYPNWHLIQVSPSHEISRQRTLAYAQELIRKGEGKAEDFEGLDRLQQTDLQPSNRIFGDFDGDGREDCAALIKQPREISLVVFRNLTAGYADAVLEKLPLAPDYTLMLARKGEPISDEATGPGTDYIRVEMPDAGAHWFLMKDGALQRQDSAIPVEETAAQPVEAPSLAAAPALEPGLIAAAPPQRKPLSPDSLRFIPDEPSPAEPLQ